LMMEVIRSSETSVFTRATWSNILDDGIIMTEVRGEMGNAREGERLLLTAVTSEMANTHLPEKLKCENAVGSCRLCRSMNCYSYLLLRYLLSPSTDPNLLHNHSNTL
jgi:hypothetical protein